jgi:hypothetical protein
MPLTQELTAKILQAWTTRPSFRNSAWNWSLRLCPDTVERASSLDTYCSIVVHIVDDILNATINAILHGTYTGGLPSRA